MMTKAFQWVLAAFLALLSFLGSSLWYDQRNISDALHEQTTALTQLGQEFHDYLKMNEMRFNNADQDRDRIQADQNKLLDRMNHLERH